MIRAVPQAQHHFSVQTIHTILYSRLLLIVALAAHVSLAVATRFVVLEPTAAIEERSLRRRASIRRIPG
jgi:hypothetical protein